MYYYITEPLTTNQERKRIEEIKSILSQLGIAGEFAIASPARTVEEHLELAFTKGFTTVVGIGSDALAGKVASTMLASHHEQAVMGVIPLAPHQMMWQMIGTHSVRETCEALRTRHLTTIDAVELNKGHAFVTQALIHTNQPVRFQLRYNSVQLQGQLTDLVIDHLGNVQLWNSGQSSSGFFQRLLGGKTDTEQTQTHFFSNEWSFVTEAPLPVLIDGQVVTQTPLHVKRRPKALNLIVNRAIVTPEKA